MFKYSLLSKQGNASLASIVHLGTLSERAEQGEVFASAYTSNTHGNYISYQSNHEVYEDISALDKKKRYKIVVNHINPAFDVLNGIESYTLALEFVDTLGRTDVVIAYDTTTKHKHWALQDVYRIAVSAGYTNAVIYSSVLECPTICNMSIVTERIDNIVVDSDDYADSAADDLDLVLVCK